MSNQYTIAKSVSCESVGVHSGQMIKITLFPNEENRGVEFLRTDVNGVNRLVRAHWSNVKDTQLCTVIGNEDGVIVGTVEHLMAALRAAGVDNVLVHINGPEMPIMDGSSIEFMEMLDEAGFKKQNAKRRVFEVLKEVSFKNGDTEVKLSPCKQSVFAGSIDFSHPVIGHQQYEMAMINGNFRHDLARARTFGFQEQVEALRAQGLARGGSLDNAVVLDQDGVLNEEGLRWDDGSEFIRHKLLDAIGDLYLAGGIILGRYEGHRMSHDSNVQLLRTLFTTPGAVRRVNARDDVSLVPVPTATRDYPVHVSAIG